MRWILMTLLAGPLFLTGCSGDPDPRGTELREKPGAVEVTLTARVPEEGSDGRIRWSPYGKQLPLAEGAGGMQAELVLGPEGTPPIRLRLTRSPGAPHYDRLFVDFDRDGTFGENEVLETTPTEQNYKFWSSFDTVVEVPVVDPESGESTVDPYPLSLWYVEDPRVPQEEPVIRFSRRGYMEGTVVLDGVEAAVLATESVMDGTYDRGDAWALASRDSAPDLLEPAYSRSLDEHAWLFEKAYRVEEIHPSGRKLILLPFDPGMTRAEEEEMNDELKVDREAPRSGRSVTFLHEFSAAEAMAREERKSLFIDFETTWCGPCKIMDEWVYTADAVVDASASVISVKVDGDERLDLKDRFGVSGFPTMILLTAEGEEVRRASGYVNVADMAEFLRGEGGSR
jgi:thiol-disulfide isomerase/thioredoxin